MAKRFIDTNYFNDPFILSLKPDDKLLYIYFWTICDHAGIFELNELEGNFRLGCKNYSKRVFSFKNRFPEKLVQLSDSHFIITCFCKRQYPGGVNTNVRQVQGAISILTKWNIEIVNNQTFTLRVNNPYEPLRTLIKDYGNGNGNGNIIEPILNVYTYNEFYDNEIKKCNADETYVAFVEWLFKKNPNKKPLLKVLGMTDQISYDILREYLIKYTPQQIKTTILQLENYTKKTYKSFNLTINNWLKNAKED